MKKLLIALLIFSLLVPVSFAGNNAWGISVNNYPFLTIGDGTVSLPGWRFYADPDNGAYRITTNKWGWAAGGILAAQVYVPQAGDIQLLVDPGMTSTDAYPGLAIGSPNDGFYESSAGTVKGVIGGTTIWFFDSGGLKAGFSTSFGILNEAASSINPTLVPKRTNPEMGIGAAATNKLSLISNSFEMQQLDGVTAGSEQIFALRGLNYKRKRAIVTLSTTGAETSISLTPNAVVMSAAIRVSTQIDGLDAADHHIQLGINGTADKYIDVSEGAANAYISVNKKGNFTFDPSLDKETNAMVLTITGGGDQTPSAGAVEVEVIYLAGVDLANP